MSAKRVGVICAQACSLILSSMDCRATTVIAITTADAAFIGVDACSTPRGEICKLAVSKDMAVGISGHLADTATQFNALNIITQEIRHPGDFNSRVQALMSALEPALKRSLTWGFEHSTTEYMSEYQGKLALGILCAGIDKSGPQIVYISWRTENGRITRLDPSTFGRDKFDAIGTYDNFLEYLRTNPGWQKEDPVKRIMKALEIETAAHPESVGPPFAVVRITKENGVQWVSTGVCGFAKSSDRAPQAAEQ